MLPMSEDDEETLGSSCLEERRTELEEAHALTPPDTKKIQKVMDEVAEE